MWARWRQGNSRGLFDLDWAGRRLSFRSGDRSSCSACGACALNGACQHAGRADTNARTPDRLGAPGTIAGVRSDVIPAELVRAVVEGIVSDLLGAVEPVGQRAGDGRVFLVGGAARSIAFQCLVAD